MLDPRILILARPILYLSAHRDEALKFDKKYLKKNILKPGTNIWLYKFTYYILKVFDTLPDTHSRII